MIRSASDKLFSIATITLMGFILLAIFSFSGNREKKNGILEVRFVNTANGKPIVLHDSIYTTHSGEQYNITKLKYYISNLYLEGNLPLADQDNYHLINHAGNTNLHIPVNQGKYTNIRFLLGVDSIRNCSGAQEGALDPMNDMFWTWNTGYVMFKLEGTSPASTSMKKKVEHHVGGYRFGNKVSTEIQLAFKELEITKEDTSRLIIEMNLDKYWSGKNSIRISETPVCTLPGKIAKDIAANFTSLFSVINN